MKKQTKPRMDKKTMEKSSKLHFERTMKSQFAQDFLKALNSVPREEQY